MTKRNCENMRKKYGIPGLLLASVAILFIHGCPKPIRIDPTYRESTPQTARPGGTAYRSMPPVMPTPVDATFSTNVPLPPPPGSTIEPVRERWTEVKVYFAYDSAAIGPAERPKLETLAQHLQAHANYCAVIEGHCDERGSDEYNRALGETRALVVRDYLSTLGIDAARLETISYGEERPVVSHAKSESQHQQNRRAEFIIGIRK